MITKNEIIKNRAISVDLFWGKRVTPSLNLCAVFEKFFTRIYAHFLDTFTIEWITWEFNCLKFNIRNLETGDLYVLKIEKNTGKNITLFSTEWLYFDIPSNKKLQLFVAHFCKKCSSFSLDTFLEFLAHDSKVKQEYYQVLAKPNRPPVSIIQNWGDPIHKIRFFIPEGMIRNLDQSLEFNLPNINIAHSERECRGIYPGISESKRYNFFNFSKEFFDHSFDKYFYLSDSEKKELCLHSKNHISTSFFTDLSEDDVVMGKWNEKLQETLDEAIWKIKETQAKILRFNCCCVPRIVGDDIYSILERAKRNLKIPFLFQGQLEKTPLEQKVDLLTFYLSKINPDESLKSPGSICVFWYHENKYFFDIHKELLLLGVQIRAMLIPTIDIQLLSRLFESELFVFSSNRFLEEVFEYPFRTLGVSSVTPKHPYGIEKTRQWMETVCHSLGKDYFPSQENLMLIEKFSGIRTKIKERGYRAGIIFTNKGEAQDFLSSDYTNNIDIIECLTEMWFDVCIFVFNKKPWRESKVEIENLILKKTHNNAHSLSFFSSEYELFSLLKKMEIRIVYSDVFCDERLMLSGIAQFSTRQFHQWYSGALDTITEMLHICEAEYSSIFETNK